MESLFEKYKNHNSYFSLYGGSFTISVLVVIVFFILISYFYIQSNADDIKKDWENKRCMPHVLPFAGIIQDTGTKSMNEYTSDNLKECMKDVLGDILSTFLKPLMTITNNLVQLKQSLTDDIRNINNRLSDIGSRSFNGVNSIMGRIQSKFGGVLVPIQLMVIQMRDTMNKIQGSMASVIFVILSMVNMLRDTFKIIRDMLVSMLAIMAAAVGALLAAAVALALTLQFIPAAIAGTTAGIVTAISVVVAVITTMILKHVDNIIELTSDTNYDGCFDEDTLIQMQKGKQKRICDVQPYDILKNGTMVTSVMKVKRGNIQMYEYDNVIVSKYHRIIFSDDTYIPVYKCNESIHLKDYDKPYIYCINTTTKFIKINNTYFVDWDDLDKNEIKTVYANMNSYIKDTLFEKQINLNVNKIERHLLHEYVDNGFHGKTEIILKSGEVIPLKQIQPGMVTMNNNTILATIVMKIKNVQLVELMDENKKTGIVCSYNKIPMNMEQIDFIKHPKQEHVLYHVVTDTTKIDIGKFTFSDYNYLMESLL
jgi:hypothetical protein